MTEQDYPLQSLKGGHWFKLICGASFQHLPAIRNLALVYALAGADCIDVAADPAVVLAAKEALDVAVAIANEYRQENSLPIYSPLLMVSLNDGEDPHFRKAEFSAIDCPTDCSRPCELICPADAIHRLGVIADRCYGCGRCLPVCPIQHIHARSYVSSPEAIAPLILEAGVDALEIHTQPGRLEKFQQLWLAIKGWTSQLKLLAISCPDGEDLISYLQAIYDIISPLPCPLVWQTDGRPMSGDIGRGTTKAALKLGQKVLHAKLPGYVQLAGGTNHHTVPKLRSLELLKTGFSASELAQKKPSSAQGPSSRYIAGVAYGSYARLLLSPILEQLEMSETHSVSIQLLRRTQGELSQALDQRHSFLVSQQTQLERYPNLLQDAVNLAHSLVSQLKPWRSPMLFSPTLNCNSFQF